MGIEDVDDVTLTLRAFVLPEHQGTGSPAAARLAIPERQVETSVVLRYATAPPGRVCDNAFGGGGA